MIRYVFNTKWSEIPLLLIYLVELWKTDSTYDRCIKTVWLNRLGDIIEKCNNKSHRTIEQNSPDVNLISHTDYVVENNDKDPKFKVSDHVRISKYKNIFAKGYTPNRSGHIFVKEKSKSLFSGHIFLVILRVKRLLELFVKKMTKD